MGCTSHVLPRVRPDLPELGDMLKVGCRSIHSDAYTGYQRRKGVMFARAMTFCLALSGLTATATAQPAAAPETWTPINHIAQSVTGRVTFTPSEIAFQNGKSLSLARSGQMLFRPEPKKKKIVADLYRVTTPDDPGLENGNQLCKNKPVAYLIVWKSEKVGKEADPRTLVPFSGQKLSAGSSDDCGHYLYDARSN